MELAAAEEIRAECRGSRKNAIDGAGTLYYYVVRKKLLRPAELFACRRCLQGT